MQRVLAELEAKYNTHEGRPMVGIVRLTGLAHTEDVVAFREIARQLCKYAASPIMLNAAAAVTTESTPSLSALSVGRLTCQPCVQDLQL